MIQENNLESARRILESIREIERKTVLKIILIEKMN
jgi:hypothetical protein